MLTVAEENYLKNLYHLMSDRSLVSTNAIAAVVNTKPSSVTVMLKKLADKGYVNYIPYKGSKLTPAGLTTAIQVIRRHRLWEVFLVDKLNFTWNEVHEVAEQLEHIRSSKLIDELDKHLDHPQTDPHGDPIPDRNGKMPSLQKRLLCNATIASSGTVVGVVDSSEEFLQYLDRMGITMGTHIELVDKEIYDGSLTINVEGKSRTITKSTSQSIYIKPRS
ncbi:MAG: metal-dependent transcriptional regulator [Nonlabens sp.]